MFFRLAKYILFILFVYLSAAPAQQSSVITVAVIDFEQEGLSELEVQTLTQRFISEVENTAKAILFDDNVVKSPVSYTHLRAHET